jgi:hypothetical protein
MDWKGFFINASPRVCELFRTISEADKAEFFENCKQIVRDSGLQPGRHLVTPMFYGLTTELVKAVFDMYPDRRVVVQVFMPDEELPEVEIHYPKEVKDGQHRTKSS